MNRTPIPVARQHTSRRYSKHGSAIASAGRYDRDRGRVLTKAERNGHGMRRTATGEHQLTGLEIRLSRSAGADVCEPPRGPSLWPNPEKFRLHP